MTRYNLIKKLIDYFTQDNNINENINAVLEEITGYDQEQCTEYFKNKVRKFINGFNSCSYKMGFNSNKNLPKPRFDIFEYQDDAVFNFFVALLIADAQYGKNRKNYEIVQKIDVDKTYEFIKTVLDIFYNKFSVPKQKKFIETFQNVDNGRNKEYCNRRQKITLIALENIRKRKIPLGTLTIQECMAKELWDQWDEEARQLIEECKHVTKARFFEKYILLWNLELYVSIQCFNYWMNKKSIFPSDSFYDNILSMRPVDKEYKNKSVDIGEGYYIYNWLIFTSNRMVSELEKRYILDSENSTGQEIIHYKIPQDYRFKINNGKLIPKMVDKKELFDFFTLGKKDCSLKTFGSRLEYCKSFCEKLNEKAPRKLDITNNKTLRGVYRAFYVDKIKYHRKTLHRISKDIFKENPFEDNMEEYYFLATCISLEIQMEEPFGEELVRATNKFMYALYSTALEYLYIYCPCIDDDIDVKKMQDLHGLFAEINSNIFKN